METIFCISDCNGNKKCTNGLRHGLQMRPTEALCKPYAETDLRDFYCSGKRAAVDEFFYYLEQRRNAQMFLLKIFIRALIFM